jgi:hypothetical protein
MVKSNADVCRERGWGPGTVIEVEGFEWKFRFRVTALGEAEVLVRPCGYLPGRLDHWLPQDEAAEQLLGGDVEGAVRVG